MVYLKVRCFTLMVFHHRRPVLPSSMLMSFVHHTIVYPCCLQIKQPILFLSGLQDEMVPPVHMQMLYAKAAAHNRRCTFVEFPTGMHMDTWLAGGDHYWKTVQLFLEQNVPQSQDDASSNEGNGKFFTSNIFTSPTTANLHPPHASFWTEKRRREKPDLFSLIAFCDLWGFAWPFSKDLAIALSSLSTLNCHLQ